MPLKTLFLNEPLFERLTEVPAHTGPQHSNTAQNGSAIRRSNLLLGGQIHLDGGFLQVGEIARLSIDLQRLFRMCSHYP
jgi:hypothetical protein